MNIYIYAGRDRFSATKPMIEGNEQVEPYRRYTINAEEGIFVVAYPDFDVETELEFHYWVAPYQQPVIDKESNGLPPWYEFGLVYRPEETYTIDYEGLKVFQSLFYALLAGSCCSVLGYPVYIAVEWLTDTFNLYYLIHGAYVVWIAGMAHSRFSINMSKAKEIAWAFLQHNVLRLICHQLLFWLGMSIIWIPLGGPMLHGLVTWAMFINYGMA